MEIIECPHKMIYCSRSVSLCVGTLHFFVYPLIWGNEILGQDCLGISVWLQINSLIRSANLDSVWQPIYILFFSEVPEPDDAAAGFGVSVFVVPSVS